MDQIWTDVPNIIISSKNSVRSYSDHNLIGALVRLKGGGEGEVHEMIRRDRRKFSVEKYRSKLAEINWEDLYRID